MGGHGAWIAFTQKSTDHLTHLRTDGNATKYIAEFFQTELAGLLKGEKMNTKFDPNQTVLIKAQVKEILVDNDGEAFYLLRVNTPNDYYHCGAADFQANEKEIVCGWIRSEE